MTAAADHFLETFERRRRGVASREELSELEAHARACPSCRVELSLMNDLAVGRDALDADCFADERAVAAALRTLASPPVKPRKWGWVATFSAVLVAGAAVAAGGTLLQPSGKAPGAAAHAPDSGVAKLQLGDAGGATPRPLSSLAAVEPSERPPTGAPATPAGEAAKAISTEAESAAQLFAKANQLRRQGKDALAIDAYRELERRFTGTAEARQAMVTLGWLLLDRARPAEALQQFELYLKGAGATSEDALAGQALAQQRLGKRVDERRTLSLLISQYPNSANAARAKKRLAELE